MQKAAHAYLQTQVTTTSQGDIVVMLYDGAIKFLNKAKELIAANDMCGKGNYISKALDVINELDSTLNVEKGGELANNLHNLYFFCRSRLLMANLQKSQPLIDEVIKILSGIRSAYAEIADQPEAKAAAQEAAANLRISSSPTTRIAPAILTDQPAPTVGTSIRARNSYAQQQMDTQQAAPQAPVETL